jgi:L-asparaginase
LTTGGTIEKTYDEHDGILANHHSLLEHIISKLRLPDLRIKHKNIMQKDSLDMTEEDRMVILAAVKRELPKSDAILILHGTDTLEITGEVLQQNLKDLNKPVIITGAMRPYEFRDSDALQNVTEALLACRLTQAGVFAVLHNRVLPFPGVKKDRKQLTFTRQV